MMITLSCGGLQARSTNDNLFSRVHNFYKPDSPLPWDKEFKPKKAVVQAIRDALLHGDG